MFLKEIRVANFRGIKEGRLSLAPTTVLIGENDCGKSSLLEALVVVLSSPSSDKIVEVQPQYFYNDDLSTSSTDDPIRIALTFEERSAGEWNRPEFKPLLPLLGPCSTHPQQVHVSFEIHRDHNNGHVETRLCMRGLRTQASDTVSHELLQWLRNMNPVVRLQEGLISKDAGRRSPGSAKRHAEATSPDTKKAVMLVERHYRHLIDGTAQNAVRELHAGYEAALTILQSANRHLEAPSLYSSWLSRELIGNGDRVDRSSGQSRPAGSAAQKLGLLLLVGALLKNGNQGLAVGSEPIVVIEDPEAHLHPMTLATVWSFIDRIKWQKILTTHSGTVLAGAPLQAIRRLTRDRSFVRAYRVRDRSLSREDVRRVRYHLRTRRGVAMFARSWLLVEGETEFWLLPELAHILGYDLAAEGVACVEFAQCGIPPLIKLAQQMGIEWHLLSDGDPAGLCYTNTALRFVSGDRDLHISSLTDRDIEHCFWNHGYAGVFKEIARRSADANARPARTIELAIKRTSKPYCALRLVEAAAARNSPGVPPPLRRAIESCIQLAQGDAGIARPNARQKLEHNVQYAVTSHKD
jgi:putative ATP-dependent endonuclease of OLD family